MSTISDETFACNLLKGHLRSMDVVGECEVNPNDPPDVIVTLDGGERWGVEVTRTYQQVADFEDAKTVASENIRAALQRFGQKLGEECAERERGYTLYLEGPGPFSTWKRPEKFGTWKRRTGPLIVGHVRSGSDDVFRFPGGTLRPGERGGRWKIMIGGAVAELGLAFGASLRRAVEGKTDDLRKWNDSFKKRWLLLLNCYPLANDLSEVEGILRQLARENMALTGFDGVFWSGYPDRTLVPIFLSQKF